MIVVVEFLQNVRVFFFGSSMWVCLPIETNLGEYFLNVHFFKLLFLKIWCDEALYWEYNNTIFKVYMNYETKRWLAGHDRLSHFCRSTNSFNVKLMPMICQSTAKNRICHHSHLELNYFFVVALLGYWTCTIINMSFSSAFTMVKILLYKLYYSIQRHAVC